MINYPSARRKISEVKKCYVVDFYFIAIFVIQLSMNNRKKYNIQ